MASGRSSVTPAPLHPCTPALVTPASRLHEQGTHNVSREASQSLVWKRWPALLRRRRSGEDVKATTKIFGQIEIYSGDLY